MIVITGLGRTGSSLVAKVYAEAGADPGGVWRDAVNAGLEDPEVVQLNWAISAALGVSLMGVRSFSAPAPRLARIVKPLIGAPLRKALIAKYNALPWNREAVVQVLDWSKITDVATSFGKELRNAAQARSVCKDPQFCLTLPVWLLAGADITHVVVTSRNLNDVLKSRHSARQIYFRDDTVARNSLLYARGLLHTTIEDSNIPYTILRYPDMAASPQRLAASLPLANGVSRQTLEEAVWRVVDNALVHE